MASSKNDLSYTGRDIVSIRKELINEIPKLTSKWTDFNESDLGMILIELMASVQDMQNFYLDNQAFETYLDTAVQDKNIRSLLRTMNFRIPLPQSARGTVRIVFANTDKKDITIPKYTRITSASSSLNINYCTTDDVTKSGEFSYMDLPVMEGTVQRLNLSKTELENNVNSSGDVSRRIYLGYQNVADNSLTMYSTDGEIWEECEDALLKYRGGRYYSIHTDSDGEIYILMSVNFIDLLDNDATLQITFVTSSGTDGVVSANTLDSIDYDLDDVERIYNTTETYGAVDPLKGDDLLNLKALAREQAITMGRYITLEDFKNGVDTAPYVYKSIVKDWKYPEYVDEPYVVKIWAVDRYGYTLGEEEKKLLLNKLYAKCNVAMDIQIIDVKNIDFDIDIDIVVSSRTENEANTIKNNLIVYLKNLYMPTNLDFGENISYALLDSRVRAFSDSIRDCKVNSPSKDVEVGNLEYPMLNNVSVNIVTKLE